jgi:hypothetical protein
MLHERWARVWFKSRTYTDIKWAEVEVLDKAFKNWYIHNTDTILYLTSCSSGTSIFAASQVESFFLIDLDDWKEGLAWESELDKLREESKGSWE